MDDLYDIGVDLKITIHWREPVKDHAEQIERDLAQQKVDYAAYIFAREIKEKVNK